jgi:hypothetical protein
VVLWFIVFYLLFDKGCPKTRPSSSKSPINSGSGVEYPGVSENLRESVGTVLLSHFSQEDPEERKKTKEPEETVLLSHFSRRVTKGRSFCHIFPGG